MIPVNTYVKLPFDTEGYIIKYKDKLWASCYVVRIAFSNSFWKAGDIEEFLEKRIEILL